MAVVLQANLQRSARAHDMAYAAGLRHGVDILVAAEPNLKKTKNDTRWIKDKSNDVAVYVLNKKTKILGATAGRGVLTIKTGFSELTCCYLSPNVPYDIFEGQLEAVESAVPSGTERIILGDVNAKSPLWGAPREDRRGEAVVELLDSLDMVVLNDGKVPTWRRGAQHSFIDITAATMSTAGKIRNWRVLNEESLSDHGFIIFEVEGTRIPRPTIEKQRPVLDVGKLRTEVERAMRHLSDDRLGVREVVGTLKKAQTAATVTRRGREMKLPYWWTADVETARGECLACRRRYTRSRPGGGLDTSLLQEYKNKKKLLNKEIKRAKRARWCEVLGSLEDDIWGKGYQMVTRDLKGGGAPYELSHEARMDIARRLFPTEEDEDMGGFGRGQHHVPPFTVEEVRAAALRLKNGKSPGMDGVLAETVKEAARTAPEALARFYGNVADGGGFPVEWKTAKLILIWKGKVPIEAPGSQRPICLVDSLSKMYEHLLRGRIEREVEEGRGLSPRQYGFRKGRSTIQAAQHVQRVVDEAWEQRLCAMVLLDIRNAFNTARWSMIMRALRERNISDYLMAILANYFNDRAINIGGRTMATYMGVPQGSVLGPLLWNIMYDGVLDARLPAGGIAIAFADDLAVLVTANAPEDLNYKVNESLESIRAWMDDHKLQLAPEKTEVILLKGGLRRKKITDFWMGGTELLPTRAVRYLGISLDVQNTFGVHVQRVCEKAEKQAGALHRLMPNVGGMGSRRRMLYLQVIQSTLLYAAPVWRRALRIQKYRNLLAGVQRRALVRVASAYRTVSREAMNVITAVPPIDLLVEERGRLYDSEEGHLEARKSAERSSTLEHWQRRWDAEGTKALWTKKLIPNIESWYRCRHRALSYGLTQFLSGHGSFKAYTHRIGKEADSSCVYCGAEEDTPDHTVMSCVRWGEDRDSVLWWREAGAGFTGRRLIEEMVAEPVKWREAAGIINKIMAKKEEEERRRQAE